MVKLSKKKNCNKCKALCTNGCDLGYKIEEHIEDETGYFVIYRPKEICPKPLTNSDWCYATQFYNKAVIDINSN